MDVWAERQGATMAGKARCALLNLDRSAFILTEEEAGLYSQRNKSGVPFTPEMRDMQRDLAHHFSLLGPQHRRMGVLMAALHKIDAEVAEGLSSSSVYKITEAFGK
jgi:hypothetical protein